MAHATRMTLATFEFLSKSISFNRYEGKTYDVDVAGERFRFKVGAKVGQGVFGIVHHIDVIDAPAHLDRDDLVIKLPNRVPLPMPAFLNPWVRNLNTEIREEQIFQNALAEGESLPGPRMLHAQSGSNPFVIKPFAAGSNLRTLGETQSSLTAIQRDATNVLFETAKKLHARTGLAMDLKAENLLWDPETQTMGLYETSSVPRLVSGFFTGRGFDAYVDYAEAHMVSGPKPRRRIAPDRRAVPSG